MKTFFYSQIELVIVCFHPNMLLKIHFVLQGNYRFMWHYYSWHHFNSARGLGESYSLVPITRNMVKTESQEKAPNTYTNFDTYQLLRHISKITCQPQKTNLWETSFKCKTCNFRTHFMQCCHTLLSHFSPSHMHQSSLFPISTEKGRKSQSLISLM